MGGPTLTSHEQKSHKVILTPLPFLLKVLIQWSHYKSYFKHCHSACMHIPELITQFGHAPTFMLPSTCSIFCQQVCGLALDTPDVHSTLCFPVRLWVGICKHASECWFGCELVGLPALLQHHARSACRMWPTPLLLIASDLLGRSRRQCDD
jgi:hypothetical protein